MSLPIPTASCPSCGSACMPGSRWCTLCHRNVLNPSIGKLAEPSKRLGAYVGWCCKLFAQGVTPGKLALGMRVVKENGSAPGFLNMLLREWIGKWISGLIFSLGYLWILIDKDRQAWHDKFVSTFVIDSR